MIGVYRQHAVWGSADALASFADARSAVVWALRNCGLTDRDNWADRSDDWLADAFALKVRDASGGPVDVSTVIVCPMRE